jgi:hypothetical protein
VHHFYFAAAALQLLANGPQTRVKSRLAHFFDAVVRCRKQAANAAKLTSRPR